MTTAIAIKTGHRAARATKASNRSKIYFMILLIKVDFENEIKSVGSD
jgi:hypothetical protein